MSDLFGYVAQVFSFPPESLGEVVQERLIQLQMSNLNDIFLKYSEKKKTVLLLDASIQSY